MELHVGLDVSLDQTSVCIVDAKGAKVLEVSVASEPEALCLAIKPHVASVSRIGVEASAMGIHIARELLAEGLPIIVVETRQMRSALSAMRNKTDRNDAHGIAQMIRMGWFRPVHVKSPETQRLKTFLANRRLLKRKLIDIQNHIRGALRTYGLKVGTVSALRFEARVRELVDGADFMLKTMIESLLEVRAALLSGFQRLHKMLILIVRNDPLCRRFMTVPGVGPVAALAFKVAIDDPTRFSRSRTVALTWASLRANTSRAPRSTGEGTSRGWAT